MFVCRRFALCRSRFVPFLYRLVCLEPETTWKGTPAQPWSNWSAEALFKHISMQELNTPPPRTQSFSSTEASMRLDSIASAGNFLCEKAPGLTQKLRILLQENAPPWSIQDCEPCCCSLHKSTWGTFYASCSWAALFCKYHSGFVD